MALCDSKAVAFAGVGSLIFKFRFLFAQRPRFAHRETLLGIKAIFHLFISVPDFYILSQTL